MKRLFKIKTAITWRVLVVIIVCLVVSAFSIKILNEPRETYTPIVQQKNLEKDKSLELFKEITTVLRHPRCINCHPSGNYPLQGEGENAHRHYFNVQRGEDDRGAIGMRCINCHQSSNNSITGVPGAPEPDDPTKSRWHLAPLSMGWVGLNDAELGKRLLDKKQNGNMTPEELVKHMEDDPLVLWGWDPGGNRKPIPIPHEEFVKILKEWVATGAHVPEK